MVAQALVVTDLSKTYRARRWFGREGAEVCALRDVSFTVEPGATLAVTGPSGAGKSTLARILAGWERADSGSIEGAGRTQLLMQEAGASLNPRFTALEVVAEPLLINKLPRANERALEWIARAGLPAEAATRRADQLSGGERTRLALVRALALEPDLLILDEPFSSLDHETQSGMLALLGDLHARRPFTTVVVLHDYKLAARMATEFLELKAG